MEGVQIFGGIGSGKTSGSGATLARKYLKHGFGGLVLTVKPDEKELWQRYCQETNRSNDLIIVEADGEHTFNFLNYEQNRPGSGAGLTGNIVNVLKTVINASQSDQQLSNEGFWENALDMLLFNVIDLAILAFDRLHIDDLYRIVQHLPKSPSQVVNPEKGTHDPFAKILYQAKYNVARKAELRKRAFLKEYPDKEYDVAADLQLSAFKKIQSYFLVDFPSLSDRTRSVVEHSFWGLLFRLIREPVKSLLCSTSPTFIPDDCLIGKIILLNLPVKLFDKVGRDAQILFKYIWQRAMERRQITPQSKPVFLWADEAQNFLHEHDIDYQATARSSQVCTVYLTQNLPNYFAHMGGRDGEFRVKSFLGTMGTKIFHTNADMDTNRYASDLIGKQEVWKENKGSQLVGGFTMTHGVSQDREPIIPPEDFTAMRTGGPAHQFIVDARIHRQGTLWFSTGRADRKISFQQMNTKS